MTNMTFTAGIGTPKYMAPEVLKQEKYKKPADIYSFAVSMFECFGWGNIYPKETFPFPWKIAEFVIKGQRVVNLYHIPHKYFSIIEKSWCDKPELRITIEKILELLEDTSVVY
ncbi:protein serine/threonine kinase, putative [Entamoeba invadens IP1]|uniref:Protein serine/threonine kinase, putative n=1 Tax=Entamoeba invadens IP1 TaxID=370355 RepID=A0A0A1TZ05_ENTIV|nr:protein serine/threonine kinase, putative [Entamoeba invadens IP1]ELP86781.1 protein serine/threonine kinase, putative [Entamoeba invadens IP1]|eukprot:XP_004253552.1 protein serine/threonine kinase, putative [Entamoeba invadens IP1]